MRAKHKPRRHIARSLEERFQPLFWLARNPPLPWPVRTEQERADVWERLDELDRILDRGGLGRPRRRVSAEERAAERKNAFRREVRLKARWDLNDDAAMRAMRSDEERLAWHVNDVRARLLEGGWVVRKTGVRLTDEEGRDHGEHLQHIGLLDALAAKSPGDPWRRRFLDWMQLNPVAAPIFKARLSITRNRVELKPDARDLPSCIWLLTAELIAGRWPIRQCAAPGCGKYIGQWTKRERLFCDAGCRTAYHNSRRPNQKRSSAS